jgi:large subunit ribosomal protein L15
MDILSNLHYNSGSRKKRKRVGRGEGSGHGGTSIRGMNGQLSRSGANHRLWFEGGQMPLQRRIPKVGFVSPFKVVNQVVNLFQLQEMAEAKKIGAEKITAVVLFKVGLISSLRPYKILGHGELKAKLDIEANYVSKSAKEKIEAVGGSVTLI